MPLDETVFSGVTVPSASTYTPMSPVVAVTVLICKGGMPPPLPPCFFPEVEVEINNNCAGDENTCDHYQSPAMATIRARSLRQIRACAAAFNASVIGSIMTRSLCPLTLFIFFPLPALPSALVAWKGELMRLANWQAYALAI